MNDFILNKKICSFIGHRETSYTPELEEKIYELAEQLVRNEDVTVFVFGTDSEFNELCCSIITDLKKEYPYIHRMYIRDEFTYINDAYKEFILQSYENTYYTNGVRPRIERSIQMVEEFDFCILFYDLYYTPQRHKGQKKIAELTLNNDNADFINLNYCLSYA